MPRKVNEDSLHMIDEVLKTEDPEFMESLEEIKPENLNNEKMESIEDANQAAKRGFKDRWKRLERGAQKTLLSFVFLILLGGPVVFLAMKGVFTPEFGFSEVASMEEFSDSTIDLDMVAQERNLLSIFKFSEILVKIREHVVNIIPKDGVTFARISFSLQVKEEKDAEYISQRVEEVLDVVTTELQKIDYTAFDGVQGKRKMRQRLLSALRAKVHPNIYNLYYNLLVFNE